jgi:hypothetical protein
MHCLKSLFILTVASLYLFCQEKDLAYQGKPEKLPQPVAEQPLPFSHKAHGEAGLTCTYCHDGASKKDQAGMPPTARCMSCHKTIAAEKSSIQRLTKWHEEKKAVAWIKIYSVPDFVFFSHTNHVKVGVGCADCHGPVATRVVLEKEVGTNMTSCVSCHRGKKASTECSLCHQLGQ